MREGWTNKWREKTVIVQKCTFQKNFGPKVLANSSIFSFPPFQPTNGLATKKPPEEGRRSTKQQQVAEALVWQQKARAEIREGWSALEFASHAQTGSFTKASSTAGKWTDKNTESCLMMVRTLPYSFLLCFSASASVLTTLFSIRREAFFSN